MLPLLNAIFYPFQPRNVIATLIVPGSLIWAMALLIMLSLFVAGIFIWDALFHPLLGLLSITVIAALLPFALVVIGLMAITLLGYVWRTAAVCQRSNFQAVAPRWSFDEWRSSFIAGLHVAGYCCIFLFLFSLLQNILSLVSGYQVQAAIFDTPIRGDFDLIAYTDPQIIQAQLSPRYWMIVSLMFLMSVAFAPFFIGPLLYNAQYPTLGNLLLHILPAWRWTWSRYLYVLGLSYVCQFVLSGTVLLLVVFAGLTGIGLLAVPFFLMGGVAATSSLYTYAFALPPHLLFAEVAQETDPVR